MTTVLQAVIDLATGGGFTWDAAAGRYRGANGRFVAASRIEALGESYITGAAIANVENMTQRFIDGGIPLEVWQERMKQEIKDTYLVELQIGRGGRNALTYSDWGRVGQLLREQYRYLRNFAEEIKAGNLSAAEIMRRAKMYANGAKRAFWIGKTAAMEGAGFDEERRDLSPAEHCVSCIGYAEQGWQPIGSLPEPGEASECLTNCKCTKRYRKRPISEQVRH